jgi:hypothetical protein
MIGAASALRKDGTGMRTTGFTLVRLTGVAGLTPHDAITVTAAEDAWIQGVSVTFSAALQSVVRIRSEANLTASLLSLTESLAGRAFQLSAAGAVDVGGVIVQDNGFVGDAERAIVELQGATVGLDALYLVDNVTESPTLTWLAACGDGPACGATLPPPNPTVFDLATSAIARNDSSEGSTTVHQVGTGVWSEVAIHQQRGRWLQVDGDLVVHHGTFAGHPDGNPGSRARFGLSGPLVLDRSILEYTLDEVPLHDVTGMGALTVTDSVTPPGMAAWCGLVKGCTVTGGVDGPPRLLRSFLDMADGDADFRLASTCDASCENSPALGAAPDGSDLGAFGPRAAPILYADADGDGLLDDWEAQWFDGDTAAGDDPDGDGLTNLQECNTGTFPVSPDTDGDTLDDDLDSEPFSARFP